MDRRVYCTHSVRDLRCERSDFEPRRCWRVRDGIHMPWLTGVLSSPASVHVYSELHRGLLLVLRYTVECMHTHALMHGMVMGVGDNNNNNNNGNPFHSFVIGLLDDPRFPLPFHESNHHSHSRLSIHPSTSPSSPSPSCSCDRINRVHQ